MGIPLSQLVQALIVPLFATVAAGRGLTIGLLAVGGVVGGVVRLLDWRHRSFSFDGTVLRLDHGVLSRNHRALDVARIQQVEVHRGAVQRVLGLAAIRVETAGGAHEPEVELRVLTEADAVALRAAVRASQRELDAPEPSAGPASASREVISTSMRHVVLGSVTGARLLVLPALIGGAAQLAGQQLGTFTDEMLELLVAGEGTIPAFATTPRWSLVLGAALATMVVAVLLAAVVGVVKDGNFRIVRVDDDLHVSRGVLSTRESVVPLRRVQLVEIRRNWLRGLIGFSTVRVRSAGSDAEGRVTVPLIDDDAVDALLAELLPGVPGVPELRAHPRAALRRALFRWLRPAVVIALVAWLAPPSIGGFVLPDPVWLEPVATALIPVNAGFAFLEYRRLAHGVSDLVVVSRRGALAVTTALAPLGKVQAIGLRRSYFQRRLGLATVAARIAGSMAQVEVLDAAEDDAVTLAAHLTRNAAAPIPLRTIP